MLQKFYDNRESSEFDFHAVDKAKFAMYRINAIDWKQYPPKIKWLIENGYVEYKLGSSNEEDSAIHSCFYRITEKGEVAIEEKKDLDRKFWIPTVIAITAIILTLAQLFLTYILPYLLKSSSPIP